MNSRCKSTIFDVLQNEPSQEIDRDLEIIQACFVVELNSMRLADEFWYEEGFGARHYDFAEKLRNFLQGPVRRLSCSLNQVNFQLSIEQKEVYPPNCRRLLTTVCNLRAQWPPMSKILHYVETLRILGYYRQFLNLVTSYWSRTRGV
jgi:hypothetical protein